ncbi:MAG: metal-dependent hydrolase [Proteobacteria bacterium]|nr:metal-dependent hydrolase [Pseudomonadota bacterium]
MEDIIARRLKFGIPKDLPRYWNDNCPTKTYLFNAIAILAPGFERLLISSVIPFKETIADQKLKNQVLGFIGQESAHGSEFIRYNAILKNQGYDIKKLEKWNLKNFRWLAKKLSLKMHVSLSLGGEHLTAIISDLILRDKRFLQNAYPANAALWRWHSIEEIEHKAVVFDLYTSLGGGYIGRITGMWLITVVLLRLLIRNFLHMAHHDKQLTKFSFWKNTFKILWGKKGFARQLLVPYLKYYSPGFHPWRQDNHDLIVKWKQFFYQARTNEDMLHILQQE